MRKYKYKVVKLKSRTSAMLSWNNPYALRYEPLQNVVAKEGTLGIFVFNTKAEAEQWVEAWGIESDGFSERIKLKIIKVLPIGRGKTIENIADDASAKGLSQYYENSENPGWLVESISNTMVYPGVYVTE